jgi:hypothetical protein
MLSGKELFRVCKGDAYSDQVNLKQMLRPRELSYTQKVARATMRRYSCVRTGNVRGMQPQCRERCAECPAPELRSLWTAKNFRVVSGFWLFGALVGSL